MKEKHSRIGFIASLLIHGLLVGGVLVLLDNHKIENTAEQNALSIELVAALLEQPQVAVSPDPVEDEIEEDKSAPEPDSTPEPDAVPDPTLKPKQEKPKQEQKKQEKPKKKPKEQHKRVRKPVKALERGAQVKQGVEAKAPPEAFQGKKVAGVVGGQQNGSQNSKSTTGSTNGANGGNANELSAYKAALQRALQRRATNSYPQREKMMRKTGIVTIKFTILPSGKISNVSVVNSSGNSNLDTAAVRSAERVKMPPPPEGFPSQATVPVKFSIE